LPRCPQNGERFILNRRPVAARLLDMTSLIEIINIVLFRFPPVPRAFGWLLIAVNGLCLAFINTIYGQAALAAALAAMGVMVAIHRRFGFVRLLGLGHVFWIPMLLWFAANLPDKSETPYLYWWIMVLIPINAASLVVDTVDLVRFINGERAPHYTWKS
jgi:hypothetical protein